MTLLQHVVSCNRIKTKEQKKSDDIYIVNMYHKATFISICNDFGFINLFVTANSLAYQNYSNIVYKHQTGLLPGSPKARLKKNTQNVP